jgi:hypothetical protein
MPVQFIVNTHYPVYRTPLLRPRRRLVAVGMHPECACAVIGVRIRCWARAARPRRQDASRGAARRHAGPERASSGRRADGPALPAGPRLSDRVGEVRTLGAGAGGAAQIGHEDRSWTLARRPPGTRTVRAHSVWRLRSGRPVAAAPAAAASASSGDVAAHDALALVVSWAATEAKPDRPHTRPADQRGPASNQAATRLVLRTESDQPSS